ncbi:hypothetical protein ABK040_003147 [Willaertia magna]
MSEMKRTSECINNNNTIHDNTTIITYNTDTDTTLTTNNNLLLQQNYEQTNIQHSEITSSFSNNNNNNELNNENKEINNKQKKLHNLNYKNFMDKEIYQLISKYFPNITKDTKIPLAHSNENLNMLNNILKENNYEKQIYNVQRRIAYLLIDNILNNKCCPYCWINCKYCICDKLFYIKRDDILNNLNHNNNTLTNNTLNNYCNENYNENNNYPIKFVLLMHSKELLRKSNTGKLLLDTLPEDFIELFIVDIKEHELKFKNKFYNNKYAFVLYPTEDAKELTSDYISELKNLQNLQFNNKKEEEQIKKEPLYLILIDSTWIQSKNIARNLCSSKYIQRIKFDQSKIIDKYLKKNNNNGPLFNHLRQQTKKDRTSTLECAIICSLLLYNDSLVIPLLSNLEILIDCMLKIAHKKSFKEDLKLMNEFFN